jgi:hypothetical protein
VSEPISHEFRAASPPDGVVRDLVLQAGAFSAIGYQIEGHTPSAVVVVRRFTPTAAWAVPLTVAALAFCIPVLSPSATTQQAATGGSIALLALIAAFVLSLSVKTTERVTFSASVEGDGSRVLVSGSATPAMRNYVLACGTPAAATIASRGANERDS